MKRLPGIPPSSGPKFMLDDLQLPSRQTVPTRVLRTVTLLATTVMLLQTPAFEKPVAHRALKFTLFACATEPAEAKATANRMTAAVSSVISLRGEEIIWVVERVVIM